MESWITISLNLTSRSLTGQWRHIDKLFYGKVWVSMSTMMKSFVRWLACMHKATSLRSKNIFY